MFVPPVQTSEGLLGIRLGTVLLLLVLELAEYLCTILHTWHIDRLYKINCHPIFLCKVFAPGLGACRSAYS